MGHSECVKVTIDTLGLVELILDMVLWHHNLRNSIVSDWSLVFRLKFWSLLWYFFGIKQRLSTTFYSITDDQTKMQNSTMEAYLQAFINYKQDN